MPSGFSPDFRSLLATLWVRDKFDFPPPQLVRLRLNYAEYTIPRKYGWRHE